MALGHDFVKRREGSERGPSDCYLLPYFFFVVSQNDSGISISFIGSEMDSGKIIAGGIIHGES